VVAVERFSDYLGQRQAKVRLERAVGASRVLSKPLRHMLFYGPPGVGKSLLSEVVAKEMGVPFVKVIAGSLKKLSNFLDLVKQVSADRGIIFIDEIHGLNLNVMEGMYPILQDNEYPDEVFFTNNFFPSQPICDGQLATVIGATTELGSIPRPFRDRFLLIELEIYSDEILSKIIINQAKSRHRVRILPDAALEFVKRSRSIPRIALELVESVFNAGIAVYGKKFKKIDKDFVISIMFDEGIDEIGLRDIDIQYLQHLSDGRSRSISTMKALMGIDNEKTIRDFIESYLVRIGYLSISSRGRRITSDGLEHLH